MKIFNRLVLLSILMYNLPAQAQTSQFSVLLTDTISVRSLQVWDGKVWYVGTQAKFGYVNIHNPKEKKQWKLSDKNLEFRVLAQDEQYFYTINILSPAYFFKIKKRALTHTITHIDSLQTAFYDALHFVNKTTAFAFSDPTPQGDMRLLTYNSKKDSWVNSSFDTSIKLHPNEAAFAASNTNIASTKQFMWIATGGYFSRIFRLDFNTQKWEVFNTPFVQGKASQGIYSIDFYDDNFGIAVGGDYTLPYENTANIATTNDGGKTWQLQASGNNEGYMTCVKIRPHSKGREAIAVGDKHISYTNDYGKTWIKISDEKNLYVCEWINKNTIVLAGNGKIVKMNIK